MVEWRRTTSGSKGSHDPSLGDGEKVTRAAATGLGTAGGAWAGGALGAKVGAGIGACLGGPVGAAVGGIAGGIAEILGRKNFSKGVKVEVGEKEAAVDLYIIVQYGIRIPEVALAAQENVKRAIETMTGLSVIEVNVHVQGVGFPEEEPKPEEARVR